MKMWLLQKMQQPFNKTQRIHSDFDQFIQDINDNSKEDKTWRALNLKNLH